MPANLTRDGAWTSGTRPPRARPLDCAVYGMAPWTRRSPRSTPRPSTSECFITMQLIDSCGCTCILTAKARALSACVLSGVAVGGHVVRHGKGTVSDSERRQRMSLDDQTTYCDAPRAVFRAVSPLPLDRSTYVPQTTGHCLLTSSSIAGNNRLDVTACSLSASERGWLEPTTRQEESCASLGDANDILEALRPLKAFSGRMREDSWHIYWRFRSGCRVRTCSYISAS